ncbi:MAG: zf-HC2 domain-containing protein [Acidimicrobiia bacterium]
MTWHPTTDALDAYMHGTASVPQVWSVEAHVMSCERCRHSAGARLGDASRLDGIWDGVVDRIDAPRPRMFERLLLSVGVPGHLARLLGATPALTMPWLLTVLAVLGFGVGMAWASSGGTPAEARAGLFVFLVLAPLVPLAGVAAAYGPMIDPAHEIATASPFHGFRLLLVRTVAVVVTSFAMALPAALLLPNAGWMVAAWILPGLALASVALAGSTFVTPVAAVVFPSAIWFLGVTALEIGPPTLVVFGWAGQLVFAVVLAMATATLLMRRGAFEVGQH